MPTPDLVVELFSTDEMVILAWLHFPRNGYVHWSVHLDAHACSRKTNSDIDANTTDVHDDGSNWIASRYTRYSRCQRRHLRTIQDRRMMEFQAILRQLFHPN